MSWFRRLKDRVTDELEDLMEEDEGINLIDDDDKALLQRLFGDLSKASVARQVTVGAVTGGCAGFLFRKVGRAAALAVGGSLIIIQAPGKDLFVSMLTFSLFKVANHAGWITVHWGKVDKRVNRLRRQLRRGGDQNWSRIKNSVELFIRENMFLATSFAGGFLIGLAV